jgi:glycosyltransferase involved in cell wall biosynthesis
MIDPSKADVSVIIPCYRCSDTIERAVLSVVNQILLPLEVILIDDASGDDTISTLRRVQSLYGENFIKIIPLTENNGPATARNTGWDLAAGTYIAFLDADDSWHTEKLKIQYHYMINNTNVDVSAHAVAINTYPDDEPTNNFTPVKIYYYNMLFKNSIATRSVILKRSLLYRFINGHRYAEDYELWLEMLYSKITFNFIPFTLALSYKNDFGDTGLSANLLKMELGVQSVFLSLYKQDKISVLLYLGAVSFSWLKFMRRLILQLLSKS